MNRIISIVLILLFGFIGYAQKAKEYYGPSVPYKNKKEVIGNDTVIYEDIYNLNADETGIWKAYNQNGVLAKEVELATVNGDNYILKEVVYKNGVPSIISNRDWIEKFYIKNVLIISIIILGSIFLRLILNGYLTWKEEGFHFASQSSKIDQIMLLTMWWKKKEMNERKFLKILSNLLIIIGLGGFLTILISFIF